METRFAEMDVVSARFTKQCDTISEKIISQAVGKAKVQVETSMQCEIALGIERIESAIAPLAEYVERAEKLKSMMAYLAIFTGFTAAIGMFLIYEGLCPLRRYGSRLAPWAPPVGRF